MGGLGALKSFTLSQTIYVEEAGRFSDGVVLRASNLWKLLDTDKLHIPKPTPMPNDAFDFSFYMVGDEAFPLKIKHMRPYPKRVLDNEKRIFNYRMSRGRKSVEYSFGMLASKFEIFQRPIMCHDDTSIKVIKAACILHNFIKMVEGHFSVPQISKNQENQFTNREISHSTS
ncbi:uncharacterized protein LOC132945492 [Metopolophium dirhodum]|uniref:uncharacterized protein LOC132945492 n=1 Tax=Metopolophium dirhodum TaxID=44670 RepID=UPI0029903419|nr:uncharacterized protein LOC132945492 [Metopolophium dirhodum]